MAAYDTVAPLYANVFVDIRLRCFEWPWLEKQIIGFNPQSLLDLGCGNGYLLKALKPLVPRLYAIEPCMPMFNIARQQIDASVEIHSAPAENLPFENNSFDMVVSLLSFRYMDWDKALSEIERVLKPTGTLVLIDLFSATFNPLMAWKYFTAWAITRREYARNKEYQRKLNELTVNADWQKMVQEFPKRSYNDAKKAIEKHFLISREKNLCQSLRGKVVGLVCKRKNNE